MSSPMEMFLLTLRYKEGRLVTVEGNKPLLLNNPRKVWFVYSGAVDVFSAPLRQERVDGVQRHLFRCEAGEMLVGISPEVHTGLGLRLSGLVGTQLLSLDRARVVSAFQELESRTLLVDRLDMWVSRLAQAVDERLLPKSYLPISANIRFNTTQPTVIVPQKGVLWAQALAGSLQMQGQAALSWHNGAGHLPLSRVFWAVTAPSSDLSVIDTDSFLERYNSWEALDTFHALVLRAIVLSRQQIETQEHQKLREKVQAQHTVMQQALQELVAPLKSAGPFKLLAGGQRRRDLLYVACRLVGDAQGIEIQPGEATSPHDSPGERLQKLARASRLQLRQVSLRQADWWHEDHGPLLAFWRDSTLPVALLRTKRDYLVSDPSTGRTVPMSAGVNRALMPMGYCFYRPLPDEPLTLRRLLAFGLRGSRSDLIQVGLFSALITGLSLLNPIIVGYLFDTVIPRAQITLLLQIGIGLVVLAVAGGILRIVRGYHLLRVQQRMDADLQAAVWIRLLQLPLRFFRGYSAGDLGSRAMGVTTIRRALSGYVLTTMLTAFFSLLNLVLLFFYSVRLALVALLLVALPMLALVLVSRRYVQNEQQAHQLQGEAASVVLSLLTGISKIRVAGAEGYAYAQWAPLFAQQKRVIFQSRLITTLLNALTAAWPVLSSLILFALLAWTPIAATMSTGDFLAFLTAFTQFLMAWTLLTTALVSILPLFPIYARLQPILTAATERSRARQHPGTLTGRIDVEQVAFSYSTGGREVLKDVTLHIRPGEFVAVVGTSGSGKSSLLRLLLDFEQPDRGAIFYDRKNLADLDVNEVRRQIGTVLQGASLMGGDIYSNIVGSAPDLTLDDAWAAARAAGIETDIQAMPMGMHTVVSEGGGNLSGGQRQRLLLARALVTRPKILLLDEATSALDNRTQEIIIQTLEQLQVTRIVVAHRLSTIINADHIYVFEEGRLVQQGTWQTLSQEDGPFARLARRQII